jgi:hypothetical protein
MDKQSVINEAARRFNFLCGYDPSKPKNYKAPTLLEIKKGDKTVFNHTVLTEMREGKIDKTHPIFEILHNVTDILLTEAYDTFSEFMANLRTDTSSLQNSNNTIRQVYNGFKSGTPQRWVLIDPDEYLRCIQQYSYLKPQSGAYDDYWVPRIMDWVANSKDNIARLAANSYLTSGPTLDPRDMNSKGEFKLNRLWYDLTGDKEIPLTKEESSTERSRYFNRTYWIPFTQYIGTDFGDSEDGSNAYETDSPLDGLFNIVAEFDRNYTNPKKLFTTLDRMKNMCHGRGSFAHIFMKGGNEACTRISNS